MKEHEGGAIIFFMLLNFLKEHTLGSDYAQASPLPIKSGGNPIQPLCVKENEKEIFF
jgi:hypothetical protein